MICVAVWLFLGCVGLRSEGAEGVRPNVVVILSDDQRADTIGALGNGRIRTPNLDALAARGCAFTNAHIMGSLVPAVCMPSRSMILTGRTLFRSPGLPGPAVPLWPEEFRKAGYETFGAGKWHNGPASFARCFSGGESIFFGGMNDQTKMPVTAFDASGKYPQRERRPGEKYSSELFADSAVEFLTTREREKPFVMWLAFTTPHDPRQVAAGYETMYDPAEMPLPKNFMPVHPFDNGEMEVRDERLMPKPRPEEMVRKDIADYYAMVSHMDAQIGRVMAALERSGQAENTVVVFAGDNGLAIGSHGLLGKQNMYEHSVRVPLIVAGPGVPKGTRSEAMVYLSDVAPTVCAMAGRPAPAGVEGKDLGPVMRGEKAAVRESMFFAYKDVQRAVKDGRYKYIRYDVKGAVREQLFDLVNDSEEMKDLSGDATQAGTMERMRKLLEDERKAHGDTTLKD